jgi:RsiW-degrading membrane proteinase PrsW (M82 family)
MGRACRVCDEPATRVVATYAYCDVHYARATRRTDAVWRVDLASIAVLVVFVLLVAAFDAAVQPELTGTTLALVGIVLALVPAAVWLAFFYRRDRQEPEPRSMVIGVAVLAWLIGTAVVIPLLEGVLDVSSWIAATPLVYFLGSVLVVGAIEEFSKYAAVRATVYGSAEFDEPVDGIVYGSAAGVGLATALNIAFVIDSGGLDLGAATIRIVVTALAQASFAGVMGYFLGRHKFELRPIWWMPLGVGMAALLNGTFAFLRDSVAARGLDSSLLGTLGPWFGLILAGVLAVAVTLGLTAAMRRGHVPASPTEAPGSP